MAKPEPLTVSPGLGKRSTLAIRSRLIEPMTTIKKVPPCQRWPEIRIDFRKARCGSKMAGCADASLWLHRHPDCAGS